MSKRQKRNINALNLRPARRDYMYLYSIRTSLVGNCNDADLVFDWPTSTRASADSLTIVSFERFEQERSYGSRKEGDMRRSGACPPLLSMSWSEAYH
jgi:hypothetical protein